MSVVINLAGAPGTAKSTIAAKLFSRLKEMGVDVELALEYCKGYALEDREITPYSEYYFFGKQSHIESKLFNKVSIIISDSPTFLSSYYNILYNGDNSLNEPCRAFYKRAVEDGVIFINFFLPMRKKYNPKGRFQNESQAREIDISMREWMKQEGYEYELLSCPDSQRIDRIIERLKEVVDIGEVDESGQD